MTKGALSATAGCDVRIETANESGSAIDEHQHSSGGLLTATSVKPDDSSSHSRQVGSTFSGSRSLATMQLVPIKVNEKFGHGGGVGEINAGKIKK